MEVINTLCSAGSEVTGRFNLWPPGSLKGQYEILPVQPEEAKKGRKGKKGEKGGRRGIKKGNGGGETHWLKEALTHR